MAPHGGRPLGIQRQGRAGLHDIAQTVENLAQGMDALPALLRQKRLIRRNKRPFVVGDIGRTGGLRDFVIPQNLRT